MHSAYGGAGRCHDDLHTPGMRAPRALRDGYLNALND
jgi:hypothetical protein